MNSERGASLLLVLTLITVAMVMVGGITVILNNDTKVTSNNEKSINVLYIAEAGLEYASNYMTNTDKWESGEELFTFTDTNSVNEMFDVGAVTLITKEELEGNRVTISSTAEYQGLSKTVSATYSSGGGGMSEETQIIFNTLFHAGQNAIINANWSTIKGDIVAGQNLNLNSSSDIEGSIISGHNINANHLGANVNGGLILAVNNINLNNISKDINVDYIKSGKNLNANHSTIEAKVVYAGKHIKGNISGELYANVSGQKTKNQEYVNKVNIFPGFIEDLKEFTDSVEYVNENEINGIMKYTGNLAFNSTKKLSGNGVLIVEGNFTSNGDLYINSNGNNNNAIVIITTGNLTLNGKLEGSGFLYSDGQMQINSHYSSFRGHIHSKANIQLNTTNNFTASSAYLANLNQLLKDNDLPGILTGGKQKLNWTEH